MDKKEQPKNDGFEEDLIPPDNGPWYCSICNWIGSMYTRFDKPFVTFFIFQCFNHGLWIMVTLALRDYYKEYLGLDPGEMQIYIALLSLPWIFKILYGLISDNVPICGSRRKSWIVIMAFLEFSALFCAFFFLPTDPLVLALLLLVASLAIAFINVVTYAIMVIQSRRDPNFGSQDFITLVYIAKGFGGVAGCIIGGLVTQYSHPKWCWLAQALMGLIVLITACFLTMESEQNAQIGELGEDDVSTSQENYESLYRQQQIDGGKLVSVAREETVPKREGFCFDLRKNCGAIGKALLMREIYQIVIFFLGKGILNPSFEDFQYFFLLNVIHISKLMFAILVLVGQICYIIGAFVYKAFFRTVDVRTMVFASMIVKSIGLLFDYFFACRYNLDWGIPDLVFLFFTDVTFSILSAVLFELPVMSLFAKITPLRIEGTVFAFLTSAMNLQGSFISPAMGTFINKEFVGVNKKDLSKYSTLILIALIGSLLTFALLPLIPTKQQIREFKDVRLQEYEEIKKKRRERRKAKKEQRDKDEEKLLNQQIN